jgi:hypothetical protein
LKVVASYGDCFRCSGANWLRRKYH